MTAHFGRRLSRNGPKTATASIKDGKEGEPLSRIKVGEDYERARKVRGEALPMDVRLTPISLEQTLHLVLQCASLRSFRGFHTQHNAHDPQGEARLPVEVKRPVTQLRSHSSQATEMSA